MSAGGLNVPMGGDLCQYFIRAAILCILRRSDRTLHELPMGTLQNINCTAAATHESRAAGAR